MVYTDHFFIDVARIHLAHEFVLTHGKRCEYPRGRQRYGLVYAIEGAAEFRFSTGARIPMREGDVILLLPDATYSVHTGQIFLHYTVNFEIHEEHSTFPPMRAPYLLLRDGTAPIKRGFARLIEAWQSGVSAGQMLTIGCLYELLFHFFAGITAGSERKRGGRLAPARDFLEQHFNEPITLAQLAALTNMSVTNFRREWKKRYPESPIEYRDGIRLHYAAEYLKSGLYTVSEIAARCGFEDVSYFIRFFKRRTGRTPGKYRQEK